MARALCKLGTFALWMLATPLPALATVTFTFDQANQTVIRPTSGTVIVTFSGTLTEGVGDSFSFGTLTLPYTSTGQFLTIPGSSLGSFFSLGDADRFTVTITSATALGLYNLDSTLMNPATIAYIYTVAGVPGQQTTSATFSVDVVAAAVPEPATLALLGIGLAGIGFAQRRKLH